MQTPHPSRTFVWIVAVLASSVLGEQAIRGAQTYVNYTFTTVAGVPEGGIGARDGTGNLARFNYPGGIAVHNQGTLYIADILSHTIRKISPEGVVTTVAGMAGVSGTADGIGGAARFSEP